MSCASTWRQKPRPHREEKEKRSDSAIYSKGFILYLKLVMHMHCILLIRCFVLLLFYLFIHFFKEMKFCYNFYPSITNFLVCLSPFAQHSDMVWVCCGLTSHLAIFKHKVTRHTAGLSLLAQLGSFTYQAYHHTGTGTSSSAVEGRV